MTASTPMPLTLDHLKSLVAGDAVAIRGAATLEPAGAEQKIQPHLPIARPIKKTTP